jgi:hypothetical protein
MAVSLWKIKGTKLRYKISKPIAINECVVYFFCVIYYDVK